MMSHSNATAAKSTPIVVAGAGIAGLSAALALAHKGFLVHVYETVSALQEVGAGVQLAPNATRILERWGVLDTLLQCAVKPDHIFLNDGMAGRILLDLPIQDLAERRWHGAYITIHRADLQNKLYEAALKHPHITFDFGHKILGASAIGNHVKIEFDVLGQKKTVDAPFLVGADGVWSQLRRQGEHHDQAQFTGYIAWRTTIKTDDVPQSFKDIIGNNPSVSAWMGTNNHLVAYPLQSGKTYNFVAITKGENPGETWLKSGDRQKLFQPLRAWHPALRDVVMAAPEWTFWPLFGMKNYRFIRGPRQAYVGDAAHAFLPFAAQGAVMAIEDAATLAEALSQEPTDPNKALSLYNEHRVPRVATVAKRGNFNSFVYHASGPIAFGRNLMMKLRPTESFAADLDWMYQYDAMDFSRKP